MLPTIGGASKRTRFPEWRIAIARVGGMWDGEGDWVHLDEAKETLRALFRDYEIPRRVCDRSDGVCGEVQDEKDDGREEQAASFVGSYWGDEY